MKRSSAKSPKVRRPRPEQSLAMKMLHRLRAGDDLRTRKARRLRAVIRINRYENDLKLQVAIDRLLDEL